MINGEESINRIKVKRVAMAVNIAGGPHLNPCPVLGVVTGDSILFQVEGKPARVPKVGDVF